MARRDGERSFRQRSWASSDRLSTSPEQLCPALMAVEVDCKDEMLALSGKSRDASEI